MLRTGSQLVNWSILCSTISFIPILILNLCTGLPCTLSPYALFIERVWYYNPMSKFIYECHEDKYISIYSCKDRLHVKGASSTQVFLYKKMTWENWHFKRTCYCFYGKKIDPTITIKRKCDNCKHWRGLPRPQSREFRQYTWCPMEP